MTSSSLVAGRLADGRPVPGPRRYRVLILEKDDFGGQITITNEVVNYPGVGRTTGRALTQTMRQQAQDFGAEFLSAEATGLDVDGDSDSNLSVGADIAVLRMKIERQASRLRIAILCSSAAPQYQHQQKG